MTQNSPYEPLLNILRGQTVESIHYGAVAVADATGRLEAWYGDPQVYTFLRSSAKPFQALPFIEMGGKEHFDLTDQEVALICASHSGTDEHVRVVSGIQGKTGVCESDLLCGTHQPFHLQTEEALRERGEKPTPNRHNCSGKHTGMLSFVRMLPPERTSDLPYIDRNHPIQEEILQVFAEMCGLTPNQVSLGIDGCSVPTFAVPLLNAAQGFARLFDPRGLSAERAAACRKITYAMTSYPEMVGGPDSFDTALMKATGGRILCKAGAEGFQSLGLPAGAIGPGSPALGIAIKVSDGDLGSHSRGRGATPGHARPAVTLEVLRQLGAISAPELEALAAFGPRFEIQNWRKLDAGYSQPAFTLKREA